MCKYCDILMKDSDDIIGFSNEDSLHLERVDAQAFFCSYEYDFTPIPVNNCPWCGNNLNWFAQDDNDDMLLVVGSTDFDSIYNAEYIIGAYTSVENFVDCTQEDFDLLRGHENMWYYVIKPNVVAKYHHIVKFERCDE